MLRFMQQMLMYYVTSEVSRFQNSLNILLKSGANSVFVT